jgi:hypothetical protein
MAELGAFLSPQQRAALEATAAAQPELDKPLRYRERILAMLDKAAEQAQWGNPVRARQHVLAAIRLIKEQQ